MIPVPIRQLMPSLQVSGWTATSEVTFTLEDLRRLVALALARIEVDEAWYLRQYPDVQEGIDRGEAQSATDHYRNTGFLEGRLPAEPVIDEDWYRAVNADVAAAVRSGLYPDGKQHFIEAGYVEGRLGQPGGRPIPRRSTPGRGPG